MILGVCILASVVSILATIFLSLIFFLKKRKRFWEERGVPGPEPQLFFGNFKESILVKKTEVEVVDQITPNFKSKKVIGLYNLWKPILLSCENATLNETPEGCYVSPLGMQVKDFEVAKNVTEKNADHFIDHPPFLSNELTDYVFYSLLTMEGEDWKTRRHAFSKLFSPLKLREYLDEIQPTVTSLVGMLDGEVEVMEKMTPITAHAAVKAFFGVDLTNDPGRTKDLLQTVHHFFHPSRATIVKMLTYNVWPGIFKLFKIGVLPKDVWSCATSLYDELTQARITLHVEREDGLSAIMKLRNEGTPTFGKIEYKEAVGHMFQVLGVSAHTPALVITHTLYRLAQHPEVQTKAREEVDEVLKGAKTISYEHLAKMKYLDHVLQETTRLTPVTGILKRTCNKDCELTEGVTIRRGQDVWVDVSSIHKDPKLFPEPLKFMPERWASPELAETSASYSFGRGPRMCIGKRLAEMMTKLMLSAVLPKFDILPSEKNHSPLRFDPKTPFFRSSIPLGGVWLKFKPRG